MIEQFLNLVDTDAERARAAWITAMPGQAMSYLHKAAEAERVLAVPEGGYITPALFPWCAAEVGLTAPATGDLPADIRAVALVLSTNARGWAMVGAEIERIRLSAKEAIRAAPDAATAADVVAGLVWPAPGGVDAGL